MEIVQKIKKVIKSYYKKRNIKKKKKDKIEKYTKDSSYQKQWTYRLSDDEKKQVDDFYLTHYGEKVPYLFHEMYTSFNGNFDYRYFPETLYVPEFHYYMNERKGFIETMSDKNFIHLIAKAAEVKMPEILIQGIRNMLFDKNHHIINKEKAIEILKKSKTFLIKPSVDTGGGEGIRLIEQAGCLTTEALEDILKEYRDNFVVQEVVKNHKSLSDLHKSSLQTFRLTSYFMNGKLQITPGILRVGVGSAKIDNTSAGGLYVGIRYDGSLTAKAKTDQGLIFDKHPDSNIVFKNYKIEGYHKVLEAVERMHCAIPQLGIVDWDFTLNEEGEAVFIESNCKNPASTELIQFAHGSGMFEENTAEILQWIRNKKSRGSCKNETVTY